MNLKIIEEKEEPLLFRKIIKAELYFEGASTPSNAELKKALAKQTKADEKLLVIKNIYTKFGSTEAVATAYLYTSKEEMEKIEPRSKKEEKKEGAAPAEEKKEAPAEEKKEEPAKEEKSE